MRTRQSFSVWASSLLVCTTLFVGWHQRTFGEDDGKKRQQLDELLQQLVQDSERVEQKSKALHARIQAARKAQQQRDEAWRRQDEETWYSVSSKNFVVSAVGKSFSEAILAKAEAFRKEIALTWFGQELPEGEHVALIHVTLSKDKDEGLTLLTGPAKRLGGNHRVWLETTRELALGSTLAHEIAHVVMDARFPAGMPPWAREGTASLLDDQARVATRRGILTQFTQTKQWPSVARIMGAPKIPPTDEVSYAVAISLTEFFLSLKDRATFLDFVASGSQIGWDRALQQLYKIDGTAKLQKDWEAWLTR